MPTRSYESLPPAFPETSKREYLDLLEKLTDAVSITAGRRIVFVNQAYLDMLDYSEPTDVVGRDLSEVVAPAYRELVMSRGAQRMRGEQPPDFYEFDMIGRKSVHSVQVRSIPVLFEGEVAVLTITRDISDLKDTEERLKLTLSLLEATLEATADGISTVDLQGNVINYNKRFVELLGLGENSMEDRSRNRQIFLEKLAHSLKDPEGYKSRVAQVYENVDQTSYDLLEFKDGRVVERYTFPQKVNGETVGMVWSLRDITQRRRLEALLQHHASHDHLTDLLNRRGFEEVLKAQLGTPEEQRDTGALLLLDLDQFKDVNDSLGHPAGDEVLTGLAELLTSSLSPDAIIARLGGDEFSIILPGVGASQAEALGQHVLIALNRRTFQTKSGDRVRVTCSVGVVLFPAHGSTVEQLMSRVDLALYSAKEKGRNRFNVYLPMERSAKKSETRLWLRSAIRDALDNDQMVLYAQPIVDLSDGSLAQYELLLRMPLENGSVLRASQFIGLAERSGLILAIDNWVVNRAIRLLQRSQEQGQTFGVAVNLSGAAFEDARLLQSIRHNLSTLSVDPSRIVFEVAEKAAAANLSGAQRFLGSLKELGCRFTIDDFGASFASMSQLKHLPVDYLKIDGSFIRQIRTSIVDQEVVKAMVAIAGALGMSTIAEAVRGSADIELLNELGVRFGQGYHIGRPRPADRLLLPHPRTRAA